MRKKLALGAALAAILATGTAFAGIEFGPSPVHPDGWGIGILGGFGLDGRVNLGGAALSLKAPALPIFWGINLDFWGGGWAAGVQGDFYFLGSMFDDSETFGWFFGLGAFANIARHYGGTIHHHTYGSRTREWTRFGAGVRVPIGLTFQPWDFFEVFGNLAGRFGLNYFDNRHDWDNSRYRSFRPGIGIGGEIGVRFWL